MKDARSIIHRGEFHPVENIVQDILVAKSRSRGGFLFGIKRRE